MSDRRYINADLERDVLRAIIFNPDAVYIATAVSTDPTFFADDRWTIVWRAMLRLVSEDKAIDPSLIQSVVNSQGYMTVTQIRETVEELLMAMESAQHMDDWVAELFRYYQRRQLLDLAGRIEANLEQGETGEEVIEEVTQRVSILTGMKSRHTIAEAAESVEKEVLAAGKTGVLRRGLQTPYPAFNHYTNGIGTNWLIVIGAASGVGKTTMAIQMADGVLENTDKRVLVVSLEMTPDALVERLACSRSLVGHDEIKTGNLSSDERVRFKNAMATLKGYGDQLVMITNESFTGSPTADKISAMVRVEHSRAPLGLVVVDYFQLFARGKTSDIEDACMKINLISKQLNVPVILLSQFNRAFLRENRPPERSDLRSTSQLENDADIILLLDNPSKRIAPERWSMENITENEVDAIIDKNRHGRDGQFKLMFDGPHYIFSEPLGTILGSNTATSGPPNLGNTLLGP